MNTPNKLTVLRLILVIPFVTLLSMATYYYFNEDPSLGKTSEFATYMFAAGGTFFLAMITDALDGYLARKNNQVTTFGKLVDPLADKFMTTAAFVMLSVMNIIPFWATLVFVLRDIAVDGSRNLMAANGGKVAANIYGKLKTFMQTIAILIVLFVSPIVILDNSDIVKAPKISMNVALLNIPIYISMALSLLSGYKYLAATKPYITFK